MSETNINSGHRLLDEDFELLKDHDIGEEVIVDMFFLWDRGYLY